MSEIGDKILEHLKGGLLIAYRVKNHSLDYSIMNRPEPTLSGIDDHALATLLVYASSKFKLDVDENINGGKTEKVERADGRTVNYDEFVDIDFVNKTMRTTRRSTMTLQMLTAIAGDLVRNAKAPTGSIGAAPGSGSGKVN